MKNLLITLLSAAATLAATAQTPQTETEPEGYRFTDAKVLEMTPVKNQHRSGTCWCFSTMSFLEGEILRAGGKPVHLSEMWIVRHSFMEKAEKYVRMHGELNFAEGGAAHDVTEGIKKYGIVPFEAYPGLNYGTDKPDFHELTAALKAFLDSVIATADRSGKPLSTAWKRAFNAMLDEYFGHMPDTFVYEGKEYTPQSFAASLPVSMDNYIDITSFTHHPFYTQFVLEVPDNWMWGKVYNLPLDEMMAVIDHALANGYPVAWGTDVSEKGFSRTKALGIVPEADLDGMSGTQADRAREGSSALQVRQAGQGTHHHAGDAPGGVRQLRDDRRPRHGDRRHGPRPGRHPLLQGAQLVGRPASLRRSLVLLASLRGLQDHRHHGQQERPAQRDRQETGSQIR